MKCLTICFVLRPTRTCKKTKGIENYCLPPTFLNIDDIIIVFYFITPDSVNNGKVRDDQLSEVHK